jgi:hypothetical protein
MQEVNEHEPEPVHFEPGIIIDTTATKCGIRITTNVKKTTWNNTIGKLHAMNSGPITKGKTHVNRMYLQFKLSLNTVSRERAPLC